jgi:hypothetical protein
MGAAERLAGLQHVGRVGQRIRKPMMMESLRKLKFAKVQELLNRADFTEYPPMEETGRIKFELVENLADGKTRRYQVFFDPNDADGPNWHKYVVDEFGQIYELNDRGYIEAYGTTIQSVVFTSQAESRRY